MRTIVKYGLCCLFVAGLAISFDLSPISAQIFNGYRKGVQIANLEGSDATISIIGYQEDGSVESLAIDTIPANGSKTYAGVRAFPGDFSGSITVASSTKVAGLVNILDTSRNVYGSYMGRNTGSTTVSLPLLFYGLHDYFTWYSVQNVGSGTATVNISYSDGVTNSATLPPGAAKFFYQALEEDHTEEKEK